MSTDQGDNQPQGTPTLEERITAAEQPVETPQEEPSQEAPAPLPSAAEDEQSSIDSSQDAEEPEEDFQLPEDAKERTKREFAKLKEQLREERARNRSARPRQPQSVFDEFRPPVQEYTPDASQFGGLNQQQVNEIASGFVDPDGNVDVEGLNRTLQSANQRALQAEQRAQQAVDQVTRYEESRQLQEAYTTYPQLDPEHPQYDTEFYDLVSQKLMVENFARGGALTVKQAADHIARLYKGPEVNVEKAKEQAVEEYKAAQAKRQQGPVERGRGQERGAIEDHENLRQRSRQGDDHAISRRLEQLGI